MRPVRLAYIGGGSTQWARVFMYDLALAPDMGGTIALYDIDREAAERNRLIGGHINSDPRTLSKWEYINCRTLDEALTGADFVVLSILPGTFDEMESDVHSPERYGIYQSVGDTAGPGGVLRAMRTVPLYYGFADRIRAICPDAWVINFTNPMSACVKALYDEFPEIKAFGCCHEVVHAQDFLCYVAHKQLDVPVPDRHEIYTDAAGVNHFTWITKANWQGQDLLALLPGFMDKYYESGCPSDPTSDAVEFDKDKYFIDSRRVKMDLFRRYGAMGAAGDRHLAEFMNGADYLRDAQTAWSWGFTLTPVSYRRANQARLREESIRLAGGQQPVEVKKSDEEAVELIRAIMGMGERVSNVNMPNRGQMPSLPLGSIVETNCVFTHDSVVPVAAGELPGGAMAHVRRASDNIDNLSRGIRQRDMNMIFEAFMNQSLCSRLSYKDGRELFRSMVSSTRDYLVDWFGEKELEF